MADAVSPRLRKNIASPNAVKSPNRLESGPTPRSPTVDQAPVVNKKNTIRRTAIAVGAVLGIAAVATIAGVLGSKKTASSSSSAKTVNAASDSQGMTETERIAALQSALKQYSVCDISGGLGIASHFTGFFLGDFTGVNSDTEGRLAVKGDASLTNYGVADRLFLGDNNDCPNREDALFSYAEYSLVVGGNLHARNGQTNFGGYSYGTLDIDATFGKPPHCPATQGDVFSWSAAESSLRTVSDSIHSLPSALSASELSGGKYYFYLQGDTDTEFFRAQASDLEAATEIHMDGTLKGSSTTVIIDVTGATSITLQNKQMFFPSNSETQILWNFNGFTTITLQIQFLGSILAPDADIVSSPGSGEVHGNIYAHTFNPSTSQSNPPVQLDFYPFGGTVFGPCECVPSTPELCPSDPTDADLFQVLFFNNFCMKNSDVQGRLGVGGDAQISGSGIGDKLYPSGVADECPNPDNIDYSLIVGGGLAISNSKVYFGGISYGSDNGILINLDGSIGRNCPFTQGQVVDFSALHVSYAELSASMDTIAANAQSQFGDGGISFYFFLDKTLDVVVFKVTAADLESVSSLKMVGTIKNGATIIINVIGATSFTFANSGMLEGFSAYAQDIIWNFSGFTDISIGSVQWLGSILAPDATFHTIAGGAEVHGSVYGWALTCGEGEIPTMQFDQFPFLGNFYVPCPGGEEYQCPGN